MSIRVLVAEDSAAARALILQILRADPDIDVVGVVTSGEEAIETVRRFPLDLITMDINMPGIDGYEATRRILEIRPVPIVLVSASVDPMQTVTTCRALEAGALAAVRKPMEPFHPAYEDTARELIRTVKLMSEVKVVRRWPKPFRNDRAFRPIAERPDLGSTDIQLVAIGASTGGPQALQSILSAIPGNFVCPIVIVQHMAPGFIDGFAISLTRSGGLPVHVASQGQTLLPGHVYLAPDGFQMEVDTQGQIALCNGVPEDGLKPSVSHLFRSVSNAYGKKGIGILLTGMGRDGARELKMMKNAGGITIAQDKESAVVHGMPGEAIKLGAAMYVLSPSQIAAALGTLMEKHPPEKALRDKIK